MSQKHWIVDNKPLVARRALKADDESNESCVGPSGQLGG